MPIEFLSPTTARCLVTPSDGVLVTAALLEGVEADAFCCLLLTDTLDVLGGVVVDRTPSADAVCEFTERVVGRLVLPEDDASLGAAVLASRRADDTPDPRDLDRWCELDDLCDLAGLRLIDWFVLSPNRVVLPRERLGVPSRWPAERPG